MVEKEWRDMNGLVADTKKAESTGARWE